MKNAGFWLILLMLNSLPGCTPKQTTDSGLYRTHILLLRDNYRRNEPFARVTLELPLAYDTLLEWTDMSCTSTYMQRFTNHAACLTKESGYVKMKVCQDSIDRLTITSDEFTNQEKSKQELLTRDVRRVNHLCLDLSNGLDSVTWFNHSFGEIDGYSARILDYDTHIGIHNYLFNRTPQNVPLDTIQQVLVYVQIGHKEARFKFEQQKKYRRPHFRRDAYHTLRTMQIQELPQQPATHSTAAAD